MNVLPRPELLVCWVRDHATPGATIEPLDARHVMVARHTADGRRFVRCLRCDTWMVVAAPEPGTTMRVDDVAELARPRRGRRSVRRW